MTKLLSVVFLLCLAPLSISSFQPVAFPLRNLTSNRGARKVTKLFLFDGLFGKKDKGDLASFSLPRDNSAALAQYIQQWAETLQDSATLTTPVKVVPNENGAQILFRPKESFYKSKEEERATEEGGAENKMSNKPKKQGGVEVIVEGDGRLVARRCEMDEGTMIREMSEESIIASLKKAVGVWKAEH